VPRLEIELTSDRGDGTWTWRAAGAKQPKGVLTGDLVPGGCKVGDILRAEADFELDGINVTSLMAPKADERKSVERLDLLSRQAATEGGVTTSLVEKRSRDRGDRGPRDRGDSARGDRADRGPRAPREGGAPRRERTEPRGGNRPDARGATRPDRRGERQRPPADRGAGPRTDTGPGREARPDRPRQPREGRPEAAKPKPPRFQPARIHRDAAIAALPEEQRPVAEQLLKGGVRAVRDALTAQGIDPGPMVTLAENLTPTLRAAEWRDRADAAAADLESVPLRELRAIVTAAGDAAKGEENRELAAKLKEALAKRQETLRTEWVEGVSSAIDAGRPLRALRQATRPAGPGSRIPAELAVKLSQAAGAAMTATTPPQRWLDLLEAVVASPVSRTVRPEALPENAPEDLLVKARAAAGAVPALAALLGMSVPPPPPRRAVPPPRPPRPRPTNRPAPSPAPASGSPEPAPLAAAEVSEPAPAPEEVPAPQVETGTPAESADMAEAARTVLAATDSSTQSESEVPASADEADAPLVGIVSDDVENPVLVEELDQTGDDAQL
jgi:hypothetical protein